VPDGDTVTWTVAEGHRGRRWREVRAAASGIVHSLLLELDSDGRFAHLELSTRAGLLTLHPEGDGSLHGNAVTGEGIRHVAGLAWPRDAVVLLDGSPVSTAAAAGAGEAGDDAPSPCLRIGRDLALALDTASIDRSGVDARGLPVLVDGRIWPLELAD
jgi:hypothetical protein